MEYISPGRLLQMNGIEISPSERRTTEQIAADYIAKGLIILDPSIEVRGFSEQLTGRVKTESHKRRLTTEESALACAISQEDEVKNPRTRDGACKRADRIQLASRVVLEGCCRESSGYPIVCAAMGVRVPMCEMIEIVQNSDSNPRNKV